MHLIISILLSSKKLPNPMLDIQMAYLQTNTRLENLEVVERVDNTVQKRK
ncbi:MAG TPA: hypothetical protein VFY50_02955 [Candidatus Nitrosocosmicus sp.]|nr:hypothetical protein [Candidatus Nitrosocosmicus sp.]